MRVWCVYPPISHPFTGIFQTTTSAETRKLVAAYLHGNGLTPLTSNRRALLMGVRGARHPGGGAGGKAQSAVKTEKEAPAPYTTSKQRRA